MEDHYGAGRTFQACPPPSSFPGLQSTWTWPWGQRCSHSSGFWAALGCFQFQSSDVAAFESQSGLRRPFGFSLWCCFSSSHVIPAPHLLAFPWCWERAETLSCSHGNDGVQDAVRALMCTFAPLNVSLSTGPCPALASTAPKTTLDLINVCRQGQKNAVWWESHVWLKSQLTVFFFVRCWSACLGFRKCTLD